jgi:hypothetical protein
VPGGTSQKAGRGRASGKRAEKSGRTTPRKESGRYTPPIPRTERHSPRWYPFLILGLLGIGVLVIILNYVDTLPSSPSDWYTLGGIVAILAGVFSATFYR